MRKSFALIFGVLVALGCDTKTTGTTSPADMAAKAKPADLAVFQSQCGRPGDTGNSIGVGKFCMSIDDCTGMGMKTNICSSLGNDPNKPDEWTFFCTIYPCHADAGMNECGENAYCNCSDPRACACAPFACSGAMDGGTKD